MSALIAAQFLSDMGTPFTDFLVGGQQQKLQKEQQRHRNTVTAISSNLQRNKTTLQEIDVRNANRRSDQAVQLQAMQDVGQAEAFAAAAGVAGGSVAAVMRGLKRSELNAQFARIENTAGAYNALGQQRTNINVSQIFQTDNTVLPKPSVAALLSAVGTAGLQAYKDSRPK